MSVEDNCGSSSSDDGAWPDPSPFIARRSYRSPPPSAHSSFSTPRASGGSRGISNFVEEQLLRDIEAFGGIASVNLSHICNLKTETYGEPHSLERKKIQNKVNRWKALSVRDYRRVLDLYEIDANTPRTRRASTTPPPTSSEGQEPTSEEQNNNSLSALAIRFQPADLQATPGESEFIRFSSSLQIMLSTPTAGPPGMKSGSKNIMYIQRVLAAGEFVEIEADLEYPERNREVNLFLFSAKKHEGKLHDGLSIELQADSRDVTKGLYKAFLLPNGRGVFLKFPGQVASYLQDHSLVKKSEVKGNDHCERLQQSRDLTRNAIQQSESRSEKNIVLKFPSYISLSNAIYSPRSKDGEINMMMAPYTHSVALSSETFPTLSCRVGWRLHIVEANERVVDDIDDGGSNYEDDLVKRLQGISSSSTTPLPMNIPKKKQKKITRFETDVNQTAPDRAVFTSHPPPATARSQQTTAETTPRNKEVDQQLSHAISASRGGSLSSQSEQQQIASTKTAADNKDVHMDIDEGSHMNRLYSMFRDASSKVSGAGSAARAFSMTRENTSSLQKRIVDQYQPQSAAGLEGRAGRGSLSSSSDEEVGGGALDDVYMDDEGGHLKRLYSSLSENDVERASGSGNSSGSRGSSGDSTTNDDATV